MGLITVGGKEIVKKGGRKAANEEAANLVKGATGKVAGSKTSAANELNLEDFQPRQTYGKFSGKYEQESGKAAREAMEGSGGRLATRASDETNGSANALTRRTGLAETAANARTRAEKDMGMADVVEAVKLKDETLRAGTRAAGSSGGGKAAGIAAGIAGAGSLGVIALMDRNEKEPSKANKASESTSSNKASESKDGGSLAQQVKDMPEKKAKKTISDFEKAFAKARKDGDKTFSFKGSEFTTRLKNESVSSFNKKFESQEDFPRRLYESKENAARYEAGEFNALAKGGFVKAKPKAHNGNRTSQSMQYNCIDMGKFMKKPK